MLVTVLLIAGSWLHMTAGMVGSLFVEKLLSVSNLFAMKRNGEKRQPGREMAVGMTSKRDELVPFLKWAGGKRWLQDRLLEITTGLRFRTYYEPFLGSAAIYFALRPLNAVLSDLNSELIDCYQAIRHSPDEVWRTLCEHAHAHNEDYYYRVRESTPTEACARAARLIYLNRTCWNGLYRVNKKGVFNVPRGSKNSVILPSDNFANVSEQLKSSELMSADFEEVVDMAGDSDLIFADPPYTVKHNYNGFRKYNDHIFSWADQVRLAAALQRAVRRGVYVIHTKEALN